MIYMYYNHEVSHIIEYKSYLTIPVCLHSFVKWAYIYGFLTYSCIQTDIVK